MTNSPYRTMDDHKRPTEDETLLEGPQPRGRHDKEQILVSDPWRVLRIMGEFVWGFDNLSDVRDGVSIFGSARTPATDPHYAAAVETARLLARAGIPVITVCESEYSHLETAKRVPAHRGVAVVSGILGEKDVEAAARRYRAAVDAALSH